VLYFALKLKKKFACFRWRFGVFFVLCVSLHIHTCFIVILIIFAIKHKKAHFKLYKTVMHLRVMNKQSVFIK